MADEPVKLRYATADKSRLVEEGDPAARYVVNPNSPGEFADLLKGEADEPAKAEAAPAEAKAEEPAEDKADRAPRARK